MSQRVNFADPAIEPGDEALEQLSREAFAEVSSRHREALARLRTQVSALRVDVLAYAATLSARPGGDRR
jgi:hypothetical protein